MTANNDPDTNARFTSETLPRPAADQATDGAARARAPRLEYGLSARAGAADKPAADRRDGGRMKRRERQPCSNCAKAIITTESTARPIVTKRIAAAPSDTNRMAFKLKRA